MVDFIKDLIVSVFGSWSWLGIIIIAMIPVIELRGAIPFAMSAAVWGSQALNWWQAWICCVVGATLPAFIIIPFLLPVFAWMKKTKGFKKIADFFDKIFKKKSDPIKEKLLTESELKKRERIYFFGLVAFVATPLPFTGAWTGSAVSAYLNIKYLKGVLYVFIGNIIDGALMVLLCTVFAGFEHIILYAFLIFIGVLILGWIAWSLLKKKKIVEEIVAD